MSRERKKPEEVEVEEGRGRALSAFPFQYSVEKEERGGRKEGEVGRIFRRGNAGVVPPDLHRATESTSPFQLLLFVLCLKCDELEVPLTSLLCLYLCFPFSFPLFSSISPSFSLIFCFFCCTILHLCVPTCIRFLPLSSGKSAQAFIR